MSSVLAEICARKLEHVAACEQRTPLAALEARLDQAGPVRGFRARLLRDAEQQGYGLICEIKKASPSRGLIRNVFSPADHAHDYQAGGASCLSVLTDTPYFQGRDADLPTARDACTLPALRKDFMLTAYQVIEARVLGADCILLIMAALSDDTAASLQRLARDLGMDVLIEVHDSDELQRALALPDGMIGINNRNLKTLEVSLDTTVTLAPAVPSDRLLVCESGLRTIDDLDRMVEAGARGFLVGESLMRQDDLVAAVRGLLPAASSAA